MIILIIITTIIKIIKIVITKTKGNREEKKRERLREQ